MQFKDNSVHHLILNDKPNVMTELASKGTRSVEIIEIMNGPDIPFIQLSKSESEFSISLVDKSILFITS